MLRATDHWDEIERLKVENGDAGMTTIDEVDVTARFTPQTGVVMSFNDVGTGNRFFSLSGIDSDMLDTVATVVVDGINANRTEPPFIDAHDPRHEEQHNRIHGPTPAWRSEPG